MYGMENQMAKKTRRLGDLYVVGKELVFDDDEGDPIVVFVRKLNPIEHEKVLRRANAVRAAMVANLRDPSSTDFKELDAEMLDLEREELIEILTEEERAKKLPSIEAQVKDRDEWAKEDYLDGLIDAWTDGLSDEYAKDPEHVEAKRVKEEMDRVIAQVDEEIDAYLINYKRDLEELSDEKLRDMAKKSRVNFKTNSAWFTEFRRSEIWLAVKQQDKKTNYFESREEIDGLPLEVMAELVTAYRELSVDPLEGKELLGQDDSSD